jgi:KaiC/GvpD/RAD55 family RecA-like ATPase
VGITGVGLFPYPHLKERAMGTNLNILCYKLFHEESYDLVIKNFSRLQWMATQKRFDTDYSRTLLAFILYCKKRGEQPTPGKLVQFCDQADSNDPDLCEIAGSEFSDILREELGGLKKDNIDPSVLALFPDLAVSIDTCDRYVADDWADWCASTYKEIFVSRDNNKDRKKKAKLGPDAAKAWLREQWAIADAAHGNLLESPSGALHEHAGETFDHMISNLDAADTDIVLTYFSQLDNEVILSKTGNRFIGILGMSNEGKTMFVTTLAYNFAKQGKNVLYVTLETDPINVWQRLAWIHSDYYRGDFTLPTIVDWKKKRNITPEDREHVKTVFDDLKNHQSVPGLIDVQGARHLSTMDAIEEYLNIHEDKNYDVLIIDYVAKLEHPGVNAKDMTNAIIKDFDRVHMLSQKRELITISPLQVNREGRKAADQKTDDERDYELTAVSQYSRAYENMDVVLSVRSRAEHKQNSIIKICLLKVREDDPGLPPFLLDVDRHSKMVKSGKSGGTAVKTIVPNAPNDDEPYDAGLLGMASTLYGGI